MTAAARRLFWPSLTGLVVGLCFVRLFMGLDAYDESYVVSLAYRMVLGDRAFVDDLSAHQGCAAIFYPVLRLWYALFGSTGFVIACRLIFFALWATLSLLIFRTFRKPMGHGAAVLLSLIWLTHVPFGLSTLHYNAFGVGFFLASLLLILEENPTPLRLLASGVCFFLASFSYLTLAVSAPVVFLLALLRFQDEPGSSAKSTAQKLGYWVLGGLTGTFVFLAIAYPEWIGFVKQLLALKHENPRFETLTLEAGYSILREAFDREHPPYWVLVGFGILLAASKRWKPLAVWVLTVPFLYMIAIYTHRQNVYLDSLFRWIGLAWFVFPVLLVDGKDRWIRHTLILGGISSILAAAIFGRTSTNGYMNCTIGMGVTGLFLLAALARHGAQLGKKCNPALPLLAAFLAYGTYERWSFSYEDLPPLQMNSVVRSGVFFGVVTSAARAAAVQAEESALRTASDRIGGCTGIVSPTLMPAHYLLAPCRPAIQSTWTYPSTFKPWGSIAERTRLFELFRQQNSPRVLFMVDEAVIPDNAADPFYNYLIQGLKTGRAERLLPGTQQHLTIFGFR